MIIGYFDITILIAVVIINFLIWRYKPIEKLNWLVITIIFLLFFICIPYFSTKIELYFVHKNLDMVEG